MNLSNNRSGYDITDSLRAKWGDLPLKILQDIDSQPDHNCATTALSVSGFAPKANNSDPQSYKLQVHKEQAAYLEALLNNANYTVVSGSFKQNQLLADNLYMTSFYLGDILYLYGSITDEDNYHYVLPTGLTDSNGNQWVFGKQGWLIGTIGFNVLTNRNKKRMIMSDPPFGEASYPMPDYSVTGEGNPQYRRLLN